MMKLITSQKSQVKAKALSQAMMTYYTNFARTGDPNGPGLAAWPAYTQEKKDRIIFNTPITVVPLSAAEIERYQYLAGKKLAGSNTK